MKCTVIVDGTPEERSVCGRATLNGILTDDERRRVGDGEIHVLTEDESDFADLGQVLKGGETFRIVPYESGAGEAVRERFASEPRGRTAR